MDLERDFNNVIKCLSNNPRGILCNKYDLAFLENVNLYFPNLKPTIKRPDAYSIQGDSILLLEHFQFDNSKTTKKGSLQNITSAETKRTFETKFNEGNDFAILGENVIKTGKCYVENFTKQFLNHAKNIENYKTDIQNELGLSFSSFIVGFVIEDSSPLGSIYLDKFVPKSIDLTFAKEFLDLFESISNLDFVIFAMTGNQDNKLLSFISRKNIEEHRKNQIELSNIDHFLFESSFCASGVIKFDTN
ncbi:MAG: hypothetical protein IJ398_06725 [Clostridia bacterium]|nr:hypothetical protein [Clostridia bacterium]